MRRLFLAIVLIAFAINKCQAQREDMPKFTCDLTLAKAQEIYTPLFWEVITSVNEENGETYFSMGGSVEGWVLTFVDDKIVKAEHYYQVFDEVMEEDYHEYKTILNCN